MLKRFVTALICLTLAFALSNCKKKTGPTNTADPNAPVEGVEKVKPAPGTGNVQGKVLYNNAPVENIEVKLCETFSRFLSGCGGRGCTRDRVLYNKAPVENIEVKLCETFSRFPSGCGGKTYPAKTDKDGDYVIANVE